MKRYGQPCPVARSLEIIGERWTLLMVRDLLRGPRRFQDFVESLAGMPPGLLSQRLKLLVQQGLVTRRVYSRRPLRAEYELSASGAELRDVVRALTIWGARHLQTERGLVHTACGSPVEIAYRCTSCDTVVGREDIALTTRPAVPQPTPPGTPSPTRSAARSSGTDQEPGGAVARRRSPARRSLTRKSTS